MTRRPYEEFIASKRLMVEPQGFEVDDGLINPQLFPFQRAIVRWALHRGRAAIFADCGLGKTPMQLEWAAHVHRQTGGDVLILAPLAVAAQTAREGAKFGVPVTICRTMADVRSGVNITNYEMLEHFRPDFSGLVLDESSILKGFGGVTRKAITAFGAAIQYRLACTATPAPNDLIELTNHAEFLDIMTGKEIIALFFTTDGNTTHAWRLKGHAAPDFWRWMALWSVAVRRPSDLGFSDDGFVLPPLRHHHHIVDSAPLEGYLFAGEAQTMQERQQARRSSLADRVKAAADLVNASPDTWVVWCHLNRESEALLKAIPGAVEVTGSDAPETKETRLLGFSRGESRVIISKPTIAGFGLNWQHCSHMAFVGLSDSYEQIYQATRRCWRFGQQSPVDVHVVTAESEGAVVANIRRKELQADEMFASIVAHTAGLSLGKAERTEMTYREDVARGNTWTLYLGDSVQRLREVEDASVGLTVTSPPFPGMYAYTNSALDIGNTDGIQEMIDHFAYLVPELLRITMPGRMCCVHLVQLTAMKSREGWIGLKDYRGAVIDLFARHGWPYAGEVTIDKNPQIQATRNKERGLLFKSLATDSAMMRMALADYLLYFRKPGDNPQPIRAGMSPRYNAGAGWITEAEWIEWAAPVWYRQTKHYPGGIRETDVLNVAQARETDDERHLCPLQLGVIERAIKLWSAPGDLVCDPFNGIGSTGRQALALGRRYVGCELKESYWKTAVSVLTEAERLARAGTLLGLMEAYEETTV
ncbi:MAG: DNA methyltransferase [Betaproteobacteria bacterium]|nr:DNA methyltransferase [Betaproteobacteria bacterium]